MSNDIPAQTRLDNHRATSFFIVPIRMPKIEPFANPIDNPVNILHFLTTLKGLHYAIITFFCHILPLLTKAAADDRSS